MPRIALVLSLILTAPLARASVVRALSVEELTQRADLVVLGEVVSVQTSWASDHRHIYRRVSVRAEQTWKGQVSPKGAEVDIVLPGGELDGVSETIVGEPSLTVGARGAFFLEPAGHTHRMIGLSQGFFESSGEGLMQRTEDLEFAHPSAGSYRISAQGGESKVPLTVEELRARVQSVAVPDTVTPASR